MNIYKFNDRLWWLAAREGKITGSKLNGIVTLRGNEKKIGYYELIAERLGLPPDNDENPMVRGSRLERDAIQRFKEETGKEVDDSLLMWSRDENEAVSISPDGVVIDEKSADSEAVEVKCLSSAKHIKAYLTQEIPDEYWFQAMQYFIVNDDLKLLHFVLYDPRFVMFVDPKEKKAKLDFFVIPVTRETFLVEEKKGEPKVDQIQKYRKYQEDMLADIDKIVTRLSF